MSAGEYVVKQHIAVDKDEKPLLDGDGVPIVTHAVRQRTAADDKLEEGELEDGLRVTLEEMAESNKRTRVEKELAVQVNTFGYRLPREKQKQREKLIMRYKGVEPIWIQPKDGDWRKYKLCLDFDSPDMHIRCVDDNDDLHIFDPDQVEIATADERTRGFAADRQAVLDKNIEALREAVSTLREEAAVIEERVDKLEKETEKSVLTKRMCRDIESLRKDAISLKKRATALEKRADDLESESATVGQLMSRAYSEELRRRRKQQKQKAKQRLSDFVQRKEGGG